MNLHPERSVFEKSQLLKMQSSYSPLENGASVKFIFSNVLSATDSIHHDESMKLNIIIRKNFRENCHVNSGEKKSAESFHFIVSRISFILLYFSVSFVRA